jgi:hypothetical protein
MSKYIGTPVVNVSVDTVDVTGDITTTDTTPEVIIVNNTHEDTDGGREGKVTFKGQQSGGEETTLAQIQASHDGTSDDEKGDLIFKTNDGSDGASPTEAARIDSSGNFLVGATTTTNLIGGTGNDGVILTPNHIEAARDGGAPLFLNRTTSDGTIADFRKDGTTVGSLSVDSDGTTYKTAGSGGAELTKDGVSSNVVASSSFAAVNPTNTTGGHFNVGSITLPSSGIWIVSYQSRFGWFNHLAYHRVALSTSSSNTDIFSTARMVAERIGNNGTSNANMPSNHMWYINVANGNTSGKTINVIVSMSSGSATAAFMQDDGNGETGIIAWKVRESTTSGTGVSNVGV